MTPTADYRPASRPVLDYRTHGMLTRSQIAKASADAQAAFCLDKQPTYEVALAREIEALMMAQIAQKQSRIDQLVQEVAASADVEATQRDRIAELGRQLAEVKNKA